MTPDIISQVFEKGTTFAILVGTLYYFLVIYIPRKDEAYEKRIDAMLTTFQNSMKDLANTLDSRLREIEEKIIK